MSVVGIQVSHQDDVHLELLPHEILVFEALATLFGIAAGQFSNEPGSAMHRAQRCTRLSDAPGSCILHALTGTSFLFKYLTDEKWALTVGLICISPVVSDVECLFLCCLAICVSSLEKNVFSSPLLLF